MRENRFIGIIEVKPGYIVGQFQVGLVEGADRSNIAPVAFVVVPVDGSPLPDQIGDDIPAKVVQTLAALAQHVHQQLGVE